MRDLWRSVESLDGRVGAQDQARMLAECGRLLERAAVWFLREEPQPLDIGKTVAAYRPGVEELTRLLRDVVGGQARRMLESSAAELAGRGVPADVAWSAASLGVMGSALDLVRISRQTNLTVAQVARTFFAVGERFGFDWLRKSAAALPAESAWDKLAVTAVVDDLYAHQSGLTKSVLQASPASAPVTGALEAWVERRRSPVSRAEQLITELQSGAVPNLSMLAVANRALKSLAS
jgi:glutamate dehydrogenase